MEEDLVVTAANVAAQASWRYARRCFWAEQDDLEQEAMVAAYAALGTWDRKVGVPFAAYAWRACILHLRKYLWRNTAPVNAPETRFDSLRGLHRVELEEAHHADPGAWTDELLADAEWKQRVREQLDFVLRAGQGDEAAVALRTLLDDVKPADVAVEFSLPIAEVYRITTRARRILRSNAMLLDLMKEAA